MPLQKVLFLILFWLFAAPFSRAQTTDSLSSKKKVFYGTASFYADKFEGRKTASGDIFSQKKMTAACNVLPLGTWIKVTNLRNGKSVVVRTNDRLHPRMTRLVDLSKEAARQLGYIKSGLTRVKVEVFGKIKPKNT